MLNSRLCRGRVKAIDGGSDKAWILEEAARPGVGAAEVARRYGVAERVLRRWKQELAAAPTFVSVQITDAPTQEGAP